MSKLGKNFRKSWKITKMFNNTRWTLLIFMNSMKLLIFLFKFFHPHKGGGGGGGRIHSWVWGWIPSPQPHIERDRHFLWLLPMKISMNCTFNSPNPLCPQSCLKYWSFQGSKLVNSCLNLLVKVWIKYEWRLKFSIENAFLGEHDQRLFFKNIFFQELDLWNARKGNDPKYFGCQKFRRKYSLKFTPPKFGKVRRN